MPEVSSFAVRMILIVVAVVVLVVLVAQYQRKKTVVVEEERRVQFEKFEDVKPSAPVTAMPSAPVSAKPVPRHLLAPPALSALARLQITKTTKLSTFLPKTRFRPIAFLAIS